MKTMKIYRCLEIVPKQCLKLDSYYQETVVCPRWSY